MSIEAINTMSVYMDTIINFLPKVPLLIYAIIGLFSQLAAVLKKPETQGLYEDIHKLVNLIGQNFGQAKNAK